jgi:hypothetical protein
MLNKENGTHSGFLIITIGTCMLNWKQIEGWSVSVHILELLAKEIQNMLREVIPVVLFSGFNTFCISY